MKTAIQTIAVVVAICLIAFVPDMQPPPAVIITHPTEYHFNVDSSGYYIYTEDMKLVGKILYGQNPTLDSLIDKDNE